MRLFVAVNISEDSKEKIFNIQTEFKRSSADVKWVEKENLHLTLKFLGEVAEDKLDSVKERIKQSFSGIKRFEICFEYTGAFPTEKFPKVLWIGISKGTVELKDISQKLENSLEELGFEKEKREFSAHLTIGRFRSNFGKEKLFDRIKKKQIEKITENIKSVFLMKSTLTPKGPIYNVIEEFQLEF
ncbi:MAG: 2'-5' RNA ligase [Elusimicrobia bacterium RIFOXYD2_FULL_34_15]|nr:MAG: 2'-5' RNA ligase [Elusimicrobia bacterium RIFOXYD2_FULL_34_15]